ncbi:MAG: hypothetical protein AB9869_03270 [Verrucomicrobiia bacterium]
MVKTNVIPQLLSSNTPAIGTEGLRAIRDPVPIPNLWLWAACLVAVVLLAALAWWLWRHRKRQEPPAPSEPPVPPHEKAWARLQEALALLAQPRPFCILVSDTIRGYLEERFQLRAPERTTEEFLEELQSSALLSYDQKSALGSFLMQCDLVKFARHVPGRSELETLYHAAVRLVEETRPAPVEAESAARREES